MFGKERRRVEDARRNYPESVITANTQVTGKISGPDTVRIAGSFEGEIRTEGLVIISSQGKVHGDIACDSLILEGTINGNIEQAASVEVREGGRISGDITCGRLALAEGAFVDGTVHMTDSEVAPAAYIEKRGKDEK